MASENNEVTLINVDIRQTFVGDFVCSDYFSKNVNSINKNILMFTKKQFIKDFTNNISSEYEENEF